MPQKPKTRRSAGKTKKKETQEEQSERFIETARKLQADESGKRFEEATKAILKRK